MIKPDQAPDQDESVGAHSPVKTEREQDLVFLQRCFNETLSGELESWPVNSFRQFNQTLIRLDDLLESLKPTYGECIARMAILELSRKISASAKARDLMHQITGRKH